MRKQPDIIHAGLLKLVLLGSALLIGAGLLRTSVMTTRPEPDRTSHTPPPVMEPAMPIRLRIPRLSVDAPVIPVGLERDGAMGIPQSAEEVGWFNRGVKPGTTGNAVLAGHLDTVLGTPGVFAQLRAMQPGDPIEVTDANGTLQRFTVRTTAVYPEDQAPLEEIFGAASGAQLRLITCHGPWGGETYQERLVVTAVKDNEEMTVSLRD